MAQFYKFAREMRPLFCLLFPIVLALSQHRNDEKPYVFFLISVLFFFYSV